MKKTLINGENLTISEAKEIVDNILQIGISKDAITRFKRSRSVIEKWIKNDQVIYGVTTAFGEFKDVKIPQKDIEKLQHNLIISHYSVIIQTSP